MHENSIILFMKKLHEFEHEQKLFDVVDEHGFRYWDVVRLEIFIAIYRASFPQPEVAAPVHKQAESKLRKVLNFPGFAYWWAINELNYFLARGRKDWVILKISRFIDPVTGRPSDAVMDEIEKELPVENSFVAESFANPAFGKIKLYRSPFFSYKLWYQKKLKLRFQHGPVKEYPVARILRQYFGSAIDWNKIISTELVKYGVDYAFAKKLFEKTRPKAFFYSGQPKGFVTAARETGAFAVEIQHSPLNSADLAYSYNSKINYDGIKSLPDFFLVNSEKWEKLIFFPAKFISVGSDYFFNSGNKATSQAKEYLLIVSEPANFDYLVNYTLDLVTKNQVKCEMIFKLHSADLANMPAAIAAFREYKNIKVIFNEQSMSDLLAVSFAAVLIYSTVAYQAIQTGCSVIILKTGYYEGGYDLFSLPHVHLVGDSSELSKNLIDEIKNKRNEPYRFFDPLDRDKFKQFLTDLS